MILQYDLQFFAKEGPGGEKTEPATQKKLEDARRDGQVAKSKEIANGLGLLSLFLLLKIWIGNISISFLELFGGVYNRIPEMMGMPHGTVPMANIEAVVRQSMQRLLVIMIPIFLVGVGVAFGSDVAQVKWKPTTKPLQPKFSKINPIKGFKRILSPNSLVELVKAVAKIGMILYVAVYEGEAGDTVLSVGYAAFSCRAGDRNYRDRSGHPDLLHLYDHCFR